MTPDQTERDERRLRDLDETRLASRVRAATGSDTAIVKDWTWERLASGSRKHAGTTHYRITVSGRDGSESLDYSFVVKIQRKEPADALIQPDATREVGVYRSDIAARTPPQFSPVRCYDVVEYPDSWWCWLADLEDSFEPEWSRPQYETVATHVGKFTAEFHEDLPAGDWVDPYEFDFGRTAPLVALVEEVPGDPAVQRVFPGPVRERLLDIWTVRERLLERHEALPRTLCHFDLFPGNLVLRETATGVESVAIDWELCGSGPLGADAAALVFVSAIWQRIDLDELSAIEDRVLAAYLAGLREGGWRGDPETVRAGYTLHLVLRWLESLGHVRESLFVQSGGRPGISGSAFVDWMADLNRRLVDQADEALALVADNSDRSS